MTFTKGQLLSIMPNATARVDNFLPYINEAFTRYKIEGIAAEMFIAQLAVESGELRWVRELASGQAYDTGRLAKALGNTPEADGDGQFYKGRGLIQITGKANYRACGEALGLDLIHHPEILEEPKWAVESACWYYASRKLYRFTNASTLENFKGMTKAINGGFNGLADRIMYWERAQKYLRSGK